MYPRPAVLIAASAAAVLALVGCGGGKEEPAAAQAVRGPGFRFSTPGDWKTTLGPGEATAAPQPGGDTLVSVSVFRLVKPYRPSLWPRVVGELDRVVGALAAQLRGKVDARRTVSAAGGRARQYDLSYERQGKSLRQRITFVLRGRREYELLCRWRATEDEPAACALLADTFRPG